MTITALRPKQPPIEKVIIELSIQEAETLKRIAGVNLTVADALRRAPSYRGNANDAEKLLGVIWREMSDAGV